MLVRDTLTEAMQLRRKPGATGLILSLEGAEYYIFHSYQTRDQLASSNLRGKIDLHNELLTKFGGVGLSAGEKQTKYQGLVDFARNIAATTAVPPEGRHAEEVMIEGWDSCITDFVSRRGRIPNKAEVFLEFCPCQPTNAQPSPARALHDTIYPLSCGAKLPAFCASGNRIGMKWKVYYDEEFSGVPGLNYNAHNLTMCRRPSYIYLPT